MSRPYTEAELELILSLSPTAANIERLTKVLRRSKDALEIVYRAAFEYGDFPEGEAINRKVLAAKKTLGIAIGPKTPRKKSKKDTHAKPQ